MSKAGFTIPLVLGALFLGVFAISAAGIISLSQAPRPTPQSEQGLIREDDPTIIEAVRKDATKSGEPSLAVKSPLVTEDLPQVAPPQTKPTVAPSGTITISIYDIDGGKTIENSDFHFNIFSNNPKVRFENKGVTKWEVGNLTPGRYSAEVYFPSNSYQARTYSCDNCENLSFTSSTNRSSYDFDLRAGNNPHMRIGYAKGSGSGLNQNQNSNNGNGSQNDTTPPTTNIYYPQNGGTITYKIDGKVCAIQTAPTDDSGGSNVELQFQFDTNSWSEWKSGQGYLCSDSLSNGTHTLQFHSRDKAGNVESLRSISFTVNIPGN